MCVCARTLTLSLGVVRRCSVQLVEPVIKYLFLHPSPPATFSSLSTLLHSQLSLLAVSQGKGGAARSLVELMVRILPLQPTNTSNQLLSAVSALSRLLPLSPAFTPSSIESKWVSMGLKVVSKFSSDERIVYELITVEL